MALDRDTVVLAYQLFLNRLPENEIVIWDKCQRFSQLSDLATEFISSDEFGSRVRLQNELAEVSPTLNGQEPPNLVESETSTDLLSKLFLKVQQTWEALGESEPHYSVLSAPEFLSEQIHETLPQFLESGSWDLTFCSRLLERAGLNLPLKGDCLEFGCGVGRVSYHLAGVFRQVFAYDISQSHLALAQHYLESVGLTNVELIRLKAPQDAKAFPKVDFVLSLIVLQHNPPPLIAYFFAALLEALKPGGIALIQIPTYRLNYSFLLEPYLEHGALNDRGIEMHVLPQPVVFELIKRAGCSLYEVLEDRFTGGRCNERSNTFVVRRPLE